MAVEGEILGLRLPVARKSTRFNWNISPLPPHATVLLDGKETDCLWADEAAGECGVPNGRDMDTGHLRSRTLYGTVEIIWDGPAPVIVLVPDSQESDESRVRLALRNLVRAAGYAEKDLTALVNEHLGVASQTGGPPQYSADHRPTVQQFRKAIAEGRAALEPVMCGDGI